MFVNADTDVAPSGFYFWFHKPKWAERKEKSRMIINLYKDQILDISILDLSQSLKPKMEWIISEFDFNLNENISNSNEPPVCLAIMRTYVKMVFGINVQLCSLNMCDFIYRLPNRNHAINYLSISPAVALSPSWEQYLAAKR